jgi:nitrogen-specific signal transduction histidine kinase/CheY-like chemotaxis protein
VKSEEERQRLEERLRHTQKMEAIGELAGGIAHDFNNILTPIQGNAQLLREHVAPGSEQSGLVEEIFGASLRAAELTRQLLAFARKGAFQIVPVGINSLIREVRGLLSHGIDRRIEIELDLAAGNPTVRGDPAQLQTSLLNLGLNARDAMPDGGRLTFTTRNLTLDEAHRGALYPEIEPGEYVEICVSDTGVGMTDEVRRRVFEPFFTTKEAGKGTGLGLAGVYGCVRGLRGAIRVRSEPGQGATFHVLLPASGERARARTGPPPTHVVTGQGRILVIDDEEMVRSFAARSLRQMGYTVTSCADGVGALDYCRQHHSEIDLVVLDLVMPKLDGASVFRELKRLYPDLRVLLCSGFSRNQEVETLIGEGAVGFITKPLRIEVLSQEVGKHIRGSAS